MSKSKVILITGASSGFGRLMAETLASHGHQVFATMRNLNGKNAAVAGEMRAHAQASGELLEVLELDVTDDASATKAIADAVSRAGHIDVLINNAGYGCVGLNECFSMEEAQRLFDVHFFGVLRMNRAVLPHMRARGEGLLIYLSSGVGRLISGATGLYPSAKFAVEALAESYHYQLSPLGIDSVILEPGPYKTGVAEGAFIARDSEREAGYGEWGKFINKFGADFLDHFSLPDVADPQEVADRVEELVVTPIGERPLRVPLGTVAPVLDEINRATSALQSAHAELLAVPSGCKTL